ncbi:MAG: diguanylate cyclase [Candidatus Wenzhouxiangella sp. M2_3B_020]
MGLLIALAWLVLWGAATVAEYTQHASIWYPPAALTFAALTVVGWRALPWLLAANVAATFAQVELYGLDLGAVRTLGAGLVVAAAHLGAYGIGAWAMQRLGRKGNDRLQLIIIDFLLIAVLASLLASTLIVYALAWTGLMPFTAIGETWMPFWVGDMVALITLSPLLGALLMRWSPNRAFRIEPLDETDGRPAGRRFMVKIGFNVVFVSVAMLLTASVQTLESAFIVFFLVIPQMWLTYSETPFRTALSIAINSVVIVAWMHTLDLGSFVFIYQFAIAMVATTAYVGIAMPLLVAETSRLRKRVMVDSLTGAASRDFLVQQVGMEIDRSIRSGSMLCLMVMDVDDFKRINDELGHRVGDETLSRVFEIARDEMRAGDVLARFGGDEFVALLPDTDLDIAEEVAERVRRAIASVEVAEDRPLTVSVGISELVSGDDFSALFDRADLALYDAKHAGRNSVRIRRGWSA